MSYGIVPNSVRQRVRRNSRKVLVAVLVAALLASCVTNTTRSRRHARVNVAILRNDVRLASSHPSSTAPAADVKSSCPSNGTACSATNSDNAQQAALTEAAAAAISKGLSSAAFSTGHTSHPQHKPPGLHHYVATAEIPHIIHQNYMSGMQQLLSDALKPLSHFRKEWWASCKMHHPGWQHMFWDEAACQTLLQQRYPWFLDTWRLLGNSTVLKSDAIRPFILHAYGGVYLDLDSECFTDMTLWLRGVQVVLQAEVGHMVNNAQAASVPGHPIWSHFQRRIQARVAAGKRWPLEATGPHLLTDVVRHETGNLQADLPGGYTLTDGSKLAVYGPKQWFNPCAWNDWTCAVNVARNQPYLPAASKAVSAAAAAQAAPFHSHVMVQTFTSSRGDASAAAATENGGVTIAEAGAARTRQGIFPALLAVPGVAGVHHFSGSWLGLDGSKSLTLRREGMLGVAEFVFGGRGFVHAGACQQWQQQLHSHPPSASHVSRLETGPYTPLTQHGDFRSEGLHGVPATQAQTLPLNAVTERPGSIKSSHAAQHTPQTEMVEPGCIRAYQGLLPVCWTLVSRAAAAGTCAVLSIRTPPADTPCAAPSSSHNNSCESRGQSQPQQGVWLATELALAGVGCMVTLVTPHPVDLTHWLKCQGRRVLSAVSQQLAALSSHTGEVGKATLSNSSSGDEWKLLQRITSVTAVLGLTSDPFASPPMVTLDALVAAHVATSRLTLVVLEQQRSRQFPKAAGTQGNSRAPPRHEMCEPHPPSGTAAGVLHVLNHLYISSSTALQRVDSLVLKLPACGSGARHKYAIAHKAYAAYQHLFQETGFIGYHHSSTAGCSRGCSRNSSLVAAGWGGHLVLGLVKHRGLQVKAMGRSMIMPVSNQDQRGVL